MSTDAVKPLRQRMIEDMNARTLPAAGYYYNSDWTPLLAGLATAGMGARPRSCGGRTWRRLRMLVRTESRDSLKKSNQNLSKRWHYTFAKVLPHTKQSRLTRTVEDGYGIVNK